MCNQSRYPLRIKGAEARKIDGHGENKNSDTSRLDLTRTLGPKHGQSNVVYIRIPTRIKCDITNSCSIEVTSETPVTLDQVSVKCLEEFS